ncbi:MAG TPA: PilZ domain-containing protein [Alphaproteobacteria bacterium]|nr:PilZ domain-containing protein [Alphaproteobacteria bacterium]
MSRHSDQKESERRKFERIDLAFSAQIMILDSKGKEVGVLRQLGRGGFRMEPQKAFAADNKHHKFIIQEPQEDIRVQVTARVRYADSRFVGFEFIDLDADAAVELGIIIGKYYEASV